MKHKVLLVLAILAMAGFAFIGCQGGGGGGGTTAVVDDDTGDDEGGETQGPIIDFKSFEDIPPFDISEYDFSLLQIYQKTQGSLTAKLEEGGPGVGDFSRAGCELKTMKDEAIRNGKQFDLYMCYFNIVGTAMGVDFDNDIDQYIYLEVSPPAPPEGVGGGQEISVRAGKFTVENGHEVRMDVCESGALSQEISVLADTANNQIVGSIVEHFIGSDGEMTFEDRASNSMTITCDSNATACDEDTWSTVDSIMFMAGNWGGAGKLNFSADSSTATNVISGTFEGTWENMVTGFSESFSNAIVGKFDASIGTAKYDVTGTFGSMSRDELSWFPEDELNNNFGEDAQNFCWCGPDENCPMGLKVVDADEGCTWADSDTEPYNIDYDTDLVFTIAEENEYGPIVESMDLLEVGGVANCRPDQYNAETCSIQFTRNWDCTAPEGEVFEEADIEAMMASDPALQEQMNVCMAMEEEVHGDNDSWAYCENLQQIANQGMEDQFFGGEEGGNPEGGEGPGDEEGGPGDEDLNELMAQCPESYDCTKCEPGPDYLAGDGACPCHVDSGFAPHAPEVADWCSAFAELMM